MEAATKFIVEVICGISCSLQVINFINLDQGVQEIREVKSQDYQNWNQISAIDYPYL